MTIIDTAYEYIKKITGVAVTKETYIGLIVGWVTYPFLKDVIEILSNLL